MSPSTSTDLLGLASPAPSTGGSLLVDVFSELHAPEQASAEAPAPPVADDNFSR